MWPDERISDSFDRGEKRLERLETELVALRRDMFNGFLVLVGLIVTSWVTIITTVLVRT